MRGNPSNPNQENNKEIIAQAVPADIVSNKDVEAALEALQEIEE